MSKTLSMTVIVCCGIITIGISSCLLRTALPFWGLVPVGFIALWLGDEV